MTVDEIRIKVGVIRNETHDYEAAHSDEDDLHVAVLRAIAAGAENAAELAHEALATCEIDFARYCA